MIRILFICHGNICRSPSAEFVMKQMVEQAGLRDEFEIASAATHCDELGCGVYPPARKLLERHGIDCSGKTARLSVPADYEHYDLLIGMDEANLRNMRRIYGGDEAGKIHALLDYAGRAGESVADPWYTRDFERTWEDVNAGCEGLLYALSGTVILDFSACEDRAGLYAEMRQKMEWEDWYGENLDALSDILTGLPHKGRRFVIRLPQDGALRDYAEKIAREFYEVGLPCFTV